MAVMLLITIQVNLVLIPGMRQHKLTWMVVIKIFAINLYHHSHFLAAPFDFTTFFTLAILNRAALFLQLVCFWVDGINTFTCNCTSPWTSDVNDIDDCFDVNCTNGYCFDLVNDLKCSEGYKGRYCEVSIDDYVNVTCLSNGWHTDEANNFTSQYVVQFMRV